MVISKYLLKAQYNKFQYFGALIVAVGIAIVLGPSLADGGADPVWSIVMMLSTIPNTLSSVYKEMALGETELDPIYLNGWVAVFQLMFSLGE
jgi:drug/metabolite transporter (DMT)-like permease